MFLGGMAIYCTCYYLELEQVINGREGGRYLGWVNKDTSWFYIHAYVIMRSVVDVGLMFYGRSNSDVFYNLPIAKNPIAVLLFRLILLIAFYTAATALLMRFGNDLLRWIRIATSKISNVDLIFGINPDSIVFGRNIADTKGNMLVYADTAVEDKYDASIRSLGGIAYSDKEAVKADVQFLKTLRIKPSKTKLRLYALSYDYDKNLQYAQMMSESLKNAGILPDQTKLLLLGTDEWKGMMFQSSEAQYGYGSVNSFDEHELSARLLILKYPLCNFIKFDKNCRAAEDMHVLIIGFGHTGLEVLRKIIANGQFEGSNFHATIFDPNFEHRTGFAMSQYPNMFANYDIEFEPQGGRGNKIFSFLKENASKLKYIVVCLKDRALARDIAIHIADRLQTLGYSQNVYTCDAKSIRCYSQNNSENKTHWIYASGMLYSGELDKYAMALNHRYTGGKDINEDWKQCDYFSRMSSRASVDYLMPLIRRLNTEMNNNPFTDEQRENIAHSEHLRWNAFHYSFGFDTMEKEDFINRVNAYQSEVEEYGKSKIKVTKDQKAMKHVCLVDWDELDKISSLENSITHGNKDYKESDRVNVNMVMELMKAEEQKTN